MQLVGLDARRIAKISVVLFVFANSLLALVSGPGPIISGDSSVYKDPTLTHNWDAVFSSLVGNNIRPWPIVFPFEALGSYDLIVLAQASVFALASVYFALMFFVVIRSTLWASVGAVVAALLLCSPFFTSMTFLIMSEAFTLSLVVLALGSAVRYTRDNSWRSLTIFVLTSTMSAFVRPQLLMVWPLIALILGAMTWRSGVFGQRMRAAVVVSGTSVGVLLVVLWWHSNNAYWEEHFVSHGAVVAAYTLSDFSPAAEEARKALTQPPPKCFAVDRGLPADQNVIWQTLHTISDCPGAQAWANEYPSWYRSFLLSHPVVLADLLRWGVPRSLSPGEVPAFQSLVPAPVTDVLVGSSSTAYPAGQSPVGRIEPRAYNDVWPFILLVEIVIFSVLVRRRSIGSWSTPAVGLVAAVMGVPVAVVVVVANPQDALNMARVGLSGNMLLRLGLIVAGVYLAAALADRRKIMGTTDGAAVPSDTDLL